MVNRDMDLIYTMLKKHILTEEIWKSSGHCGLFLLEVGEVGLRGHLVRHEGAHTISHLGAS